MAVRLLASADELCSALAEPHAPVPNDRSFFVCDLNSYSEHTELDILLDPLTGLPFPLSPSYDRLPLNDGKVANWHHSMFPRQHEVLIETLGGAAMRSAQVQLVRKEQHNHGNTAFHRFNVGPFVHRDVGHQLGISVMAAAGARHKLNINTQNKEVWLKPLNRLQSRQWRDHPIPERFEPWQAAVYTKFYGIEGPPEVIEAELAERNRLRSKLLYRNVHYGYEPFRDFITQMVFEQDLSNVKLGVRRKFIHKGEEERGLELMAVAVEELAQSTITYNGQTLSELYKTARESHRLNPNMPLRVEDIIKHKLGDLTMRRQLVPTFRKQLLDREEAA